MSLPRPSNLLLWLILTILGLLPLSVAAGVNAFYLGLAVRLMVFAIAGSSLNLILGYGGLISLGHAAYLLIGAYSVAIPSYFALDSGWLHLAIAISSSALFALLTGAISLRTRAAGFIMITLAFAQMVYFLFVSMETFGGSDGISIDFSSDFGLFTLADSMALYYFTFLALLASLGFLHRLTRSRFGYWLIASRLSPSRMRSLGYAPFKFQLTAYVFAGVMCGISGFLLANFVQFISPEMMDWFRSAELIFMVALGGAASLAGPVFGASCFVLLEHFLSAWSVYWQLPFGLLLIAIAVLSRGGLARLLDRRAGGKTNA